MLVASYQVHSSALTFLPTGNILREFYYSLLSRIKINRNFPSVMVNILVAYGEIGLKILEMEYDIEVISHFMAL